MESSRCRAFIESVNEGSFTAAAEVLGYTPSGVSQLVTALENDLGVSLLTRTKKGVRVTEEGELFLKHVRSYLAQEDDIYQLAAEIKGLSVGSITIAAYPSLATNWLPELIKKFEGDYPNIRISLMEGITQEIFEWLDQGIADISFMAYTDPMPYEWIPLATDVMVAVLNYDHPMAKEKIYPLQRCNEEEFIMPALGHDTDVEALFRENGLSPHIKFSTFENPATLAMIEHGLGMSIMNELCTRLWKDKLAILPVDPPQSVAFGIALTPLHHVSPAVKKFLEYAVDMLRKPEKEK